MYFKNMGCDEVNIFHNVTKSNLNILLIDVLENKLFYVEKIIENKLYRIIPLFYCDSIVSSNANDVILDNKCIICNYDESTVLNFNTSEAINDFDYNYVTHVIDKVGFFDFIFYDSVTCSRLNNVEINLKYIDFDNNVLYSEDFISNESGVFIWKIKEIVGAKNALLTFKYGDIIKTLKV